MAMIQILKKYFEAFILGAYMGKCIVMRYVFFTSRSSKEIKKVPNYFKDFFYQIYSFHLNQHHDGITSTKDSVLRQYLRL